MSDRMLSDEILLGLINKNSGGGGGGTGNYNDLENLPKVNNITLIDNMSASDLGLASEKDLTEKQNALTAGLYIEIDNDTISVKRDITQTAQEIVYNFTIPGDYTLRVKKYMNGDLVDTTDYQFNNVVDPINLDSIMEVSKKPGGGFYWVVKNLIASTTQAADYSVELYAFQTSTNYTQTFITTIDADKKLIIQSELDAAINAIKDGQSINSFADVEAALGEKADTDIVASDFSTATSYTAGDYCIYEGKFYKFKTSHSGAWAAADVDEIKIAGELTALKSGLTNAENAIITPSGGYMKLGSGAIDSNNPVLVSIGSNDISDYDMLYFCVSYYDSGVASYGSLTIPTILFRQLYNSDAGVAFMARNATFDDTVGVAVALNTNDNTIRFAPSAQPAGVYYVVYGVKWRTPN